MTNQHRAIILAAGQGIRLRPLTDDRPKCMVEVLGKSLLAWQIMNFHRCAIDDIVVVTGYRADQIHGDGITKVFNENYANTNMVHSLFCAEEFLHGDVIISYGDIVYSESVLRSLLQDEHDVVVASDERWRSYWESRCEDPLTDAETFRVGSQRRVLSLGAKANRIEDIQGQYIGLTKLSPAGCTTIRTAYHQCHADDGCKANAWSSGRPIRSAFMTDLLNHLAQQGELYYHPIQRGWIEVDNHNDLRLAEQVLMEIVN